MSGTDNEGIRLNKYIASSGLCSRREADTLIESGKVTINGETAVQGSKVMDGDIVLVNGRKVTPDDDMVYIAFNKPLGVTCTTDKRDPSNIIDYIGFDERIFPVGRLDKNSSGSNTPPSPRIRLPSKKESSVRLTIPINSIFLSRLSSIMRENS